MTLADEPPPGSLAARASAVLAAAPPPRLGGLDAPPPDARAAPAVTVAARAALAPAAGPPPLTLEDPALRPIDLRAYAGVLWRRRRAVAGTFVLVLGIAAVLLYAQTPIYRASALVLIEPKAVRIAHVQDAYDPAAAGAGDFLPTQLELIRSHRVLAAVAGDLLAEGAGAEGAGAEQAGAGAPSATPSDPSTLARQLERGVAVEPHKSSRLVRVSFESPDPAFAARAANAIVRRYIADTSERAQGISDDGLRRLREKERELRPKYESASRRLEQLLEETGLTSSDGAASHLSAQLAHLSQEHARARTERIEAEADAEARAAVRADVAPAGGPPEVEPSALLGSLQLELARLEQSLSAQRAVLGGSHPEALMVARQVEYVTARLEAERARLAAVASARAQGLRIREEAIASELEAVRAELFVLTRNASRIRLVQEERDTLASSYKRLLERIEEIDVALAAGSKDSGIFLIDPATAPRSPVKPNKQQGLLAATALGLLLGVCMGFLLEHLDGTLKSQDDVEEALGLPILGAIPPLAATSAVGRAPRESGAALDGGARAAEVAGSPGVLDAAALSDRDPPPELFGGAHPRSAMAEAFRTIRTSLGFTIPKGSPRALVVTSASPGEGKTFTSVNLATLLAQGGQRVLLIDADLRRPRLRGLFGIDDALGLSSGLATGDGASVLAHAVQSGIPGLSVLGAGPIPPNPGELLASPAFGAMLEEAERRFDWVVLDAPPALVVADVAVLLARVPHALLVVRSFATTRDAARRALATLASTPARLAGVVVNEIDAPAMSAGNRYGRHGYGYEYGYGSGDGAQGGGVRGDGAPEDGASGRNGGRRQGSATTRAWGGAGGGNGGVRGGNGRDGGNGAGVAAGVRAGAHDARGDERRAAAIGLASSRTPQARPTEGVGGGHREEGPS